MATINISLPKAMYEDAKKRIKTSRYSSMSELIRDALRKVLYSGGQEITENGFTKAFEDEVLAAEKEPIDKGSVLETEEDVEKYFANLRKRVGARRHAKNYHNRKV